MKNHLKKAPKLRMRISSVQEFANRVILTLTALVILSSASVILLIYLPLKTELKKSLTENFSQLSYIRYAALQNSMERGLEGARSMSSRTVIRDAILDYKNGKINLDELMAVTQSKYEDGAGALEYLLDAERYVDEHLIARYTAAGYTDCTSEKSLAKDDNISSALYLEDGHEYFIVQSPILWQGQIIGYDLLTFDLSVQIHALCTETVKSELMCHDAFEALSADIDMLRNDDIRSFFHKDDIYYHVFHLQDNAHFMTRQSEASLLGPLYRLSRQVLVTGVSVLLTFTLAIYFFVIRHAKNELEDGCSSLNYAVSVANTDPLTRAGSRRLGEELLSDLFERFQKGESSPAVILFDIDQLKQINDAHGHSLGDQVIRAIAEAVEQNIRSGDMLIRWGGDEFTGIFHGLTQENAVPFARKLLHIVSDLKIETDKQEIRPTISMGISYFRHDDRGYIDVINRADRAMYQSKAGGRNRVHEL